MDYGPVVFPVSGFPRKNLGVDCVIICIIFGHCLILFLLHKEGKELELVFRCIDPGKLVSGCSQFSQQSGIRALVV